MKNKAIKIFGIAIVSAMTLASCDKGFEEMNTNPNALTDPAIKSMFTLAEIYVDGQDFSNTRGNNIYAAQIELLQLQAPKVLIYLKNLEPILLLIIRIAILKTS
ncbi:hypothetical protein AB9T88_07920 [Flavobacterium sp. LBUM151]